MFVCQSAVSEKCYIYIYIMRKSIEIETEGQCTSVRFPELGTGDIPRTALFACAYNTGQRQASAYAAEDLIVMLRKGSVEEIYEAFGAISRRKLKTALDALREIAFYDEDMVIRQEAIRTIRRIGGKKALEILRTLRATDQKEFIQEILNSKDPDDVIG